MPLTLPVLGAVSDMGPVDAMLMMEAYSNLQRQNQKLQAKILSMNDVSDRLQLLEEHNRKLHKVQSPGLDAGTAPNVLCFWLEDFADVLRYGTREPS